MTKESTAVSTEKALREGYHDVDADVKRVVQQRKILFLNFLVT